jgi:uncharacterized membrane protein
MRSKHLGLLVGMPLALSGCPFAPRCWETATCPILEDAASDAAGLAENEASVDAFVPTAISDGSAHDAAVPTPSAAPTLSTALVGDTDGSTTSRADAFVVPSAETDAGDGDAQALPNLPLCDSASDRLCTEECPCASGEGLCASDAECQEGTVCTAGSGPKFGRDADTCLPAHCDNDRQDSAEGETSVDCGGDCGCRARVYDVPLPEGAGSIRARDVSGDGAIVVGDVSFDAGTRAFKWVVGDTTVTLLNPISSASAAAISGDGTVIGGAVSSRAVIWEGGLEPSELARDSTWMTSVEGISASGAVIVGSRGTQRLAAGIFWRFPSNLAFEQREYSLLAVSANGLYALMNLKPTSVINLVTGDTVEIELPSHALPDSTELFAINADGTAVAGRYQQDDGQLSAFIWKASAGAVALTALPPGDYSTPTGVSGDGTRVVGSSGSELATLEAFVWDETDGIRSLASELRLRGVELAVDRVLTEPTAISLDGTAILLEDALVVLER